MSAWGANLVPTTSWFGPSRGEMESSWPGRRRAAAGSRPRLLGRVSHRIPPFPSPLPRQSGQGPCRGSSCGGWRWCWAPSAGCEGPCPAQPACPQQNPPVGKGGSVNPGAESGTGAQLLIYCRSPREVRKELLVAFFFFSPSSPLSPVPLPQNRPSYLSDPLLNHQRNINIPGRNCPPSDQLTPPCPRSV